MNISPGGRGWTIGLALICAVIAPARTHGATLSVAGGAVSHTLSAVDYTLAPTYIASHQIDRSITANGPETGVRIMTAWLDAAMPTGLTLEVMLNAGNGGTWQTLSTTRVALNGNAIPGGFWSGTISFRLRAAPSAGVISGTRTITLSLDYGTSDAVATVTENYSVLGMSTLTVTPSAPTLTISTAIAGTQPAAASFSSSGCYYLVGTNMTNLKIVGRLDLSLPAGVTLEASLQSPSGASSAGWIPLTTSGVNLVTGISQVITADNSLARRSIAYRFTTAVAAGAFTTVRTVTFTITAGP